MALRVWLPLNGNFNNNGTDSSYTPSIASGNSWVSPGKIGTNSLKITNIQQVLAANTSKMSGAKEISYCYWVKVNTAWSANWLDGIRWIETDGSTTSTARQEFYTNCTLIGTWYKGGSISGKSFTPGVWTHLAATFNYNTGEAKFYINGILSGSTTNIDTTYYCRGDFYIGDNGVDICENDVRIYDHCLSAAEVHEIAQGLILHYKLDDAVGFTDLISRGTSWNIYNNHNNTNMPSTLVNTGNFYNEDIVYRETCTPTANSLSSIQTTLHSHGVYNWSRTFKANTKYVFWIYYKPISHMDTVCGGTASNIGGWTEIPPQAVGGGWYKVGQYRNGSVTTDKTDNIFVSFKVPSATTGTPIIIDWASPHLLEGTTEIPPYDYSSSKVTDSSGYNHSGTVYGSIKLSKDTMRYSNCLCIPNGNTDYIYTNEGVGNPTDAITLNIWFKSENKSPGSDYHHMMNGLTSWVYIEMAVHKNGYLRCGLYINGTRYVANTSNTNLLDGNWHMLTMTYNSSQVLRYVDGVLRTEASQNATGTIDRPNDRFVFGRGASTGYYCKEAYLSDARIYATALSAADVKALYEVGAKVDNLQNLHTFEIKETNHNLLAGRLWSNWYSQHNPSAGLFTNFNSKGEYQFTANGTSAGTEYIPINPTGHTYEYDYTISVNTGNQFYIGFERYDANKTARSNNACVYTYATKPSSDVVKQHFKGTVDLSTDGTNPCAFIALRILNGWSGTTSGVTGTATIHNISLREIGIKQQPKLTRQGQFIEEELKEGTNMKLHKNGIVEVNNLIEF